MPWKIFGACGADFFQGLLIITQGYLIQSLCRIDSPGLNAVEVDAIDKADVTVGALEKEVIKDM